MEEQKIGYLQDFLCHSKLSLEVCIILIKDHEARLCGCYAETIEFCSDKFVRIILVDAAFIIEVLLRWSFRELLDENDWTFYRPVTMAVINLDMQMLNCHSSFLWTFLTQTKTNSLCVMRVLPMGLLCAGMASYSLLFMRS